MKQIKKEKSKKDKLLPTKK